MNLYGVLKVLHILSVVIFVGGLFARQLVRGFIKRIGDVKLVAELTRTASRIDVAMVRPGSTAALLLGVILALMADIPIFGFLQGAQTNWLLISNILLFLDLGMIPTVFLPHNRRLETLLAAALSKGQMTPELSEALNDKLVNTAHWYEGISLLIVIALMVLKPF